jgi:hypothetical protein
MAARNVNGRLVPGRHRLRPTLSESDVFRVCSLQQSVCLVRVLRTVSSSLCGLIRLQAEPGSEDAATDRARAGR